MVLVSLISNLFTNKTSLANKWMSFSSSNLALELAMHRAMLNQYETAYIFFNSAKNVRTDCYLPIFTCCKPKNVVIIKTEQL